jgi:ubiquinone biosynthesis monooxygenase Coq7
MAARDKPIDRIISLAEQGLRTCFAPSAAGTKSPAADIDDDSLSEEERRESAALMRVNHAGEVAAQALYAGQAVFARNAATRAHLLRAAEDERDHLAWCAERLEQLGGRESLLVPLWFAGGALTGIAAALAGDRLSFGFIEETERQVEAHLDDHLERLTPNDARSRAILTQMSIDEARHGRDAAQAGGVGIPTPIRRLMALGGEIVRRLARIL